MANNGVKIIAGTGFPNRYTYPGSSLHDELEIFVEAGLTNLQAIQTATLNAAIFLEKTADHGPIEESKYANMVLLDSNPLIDINNIRDINSVFLKGKYIAKEEIESLLKN